MGTVTIQTFIGTEIEVDEEELTDKEVAASHITQETSLGDVDVEITFPEGVGDRECIELVSAIQDLIETWDREVIESP